MSTRKRSRSTPGSMSEGSVLDQLVSEARTSLRTPPIDWSRVDARLFDRVAATHADAHANADANAHTNEGSAAGRLTGHGTRTHALWGAMAGAVAMAAGAVLVLGGAPHDRKDASGTPIAISATDHGVDHPEGAGAFVTKRGAGEVHVALGDGPRLAIVPNGARLAKGSTVETTYGVQALFELAGHASWLLEDDSRAAVKADAPLVLSLERGAIEAEIVSVPSGEAFAVDVGEVRIAVHGTHLRVARHADRVTVDLSEGVVSIGEPPRFGSTYGALVVAPAHVEFSLRDAAVLSKVHDDGNDGGLLRITHDRAAVRASVDLASFAEVKPSQQPGAEVPPPAIERSHPAAGSPFSADGNSTPGTSARRTGRTQLGSGSLPTEPAAADPHPEETIAAAVRVCAADRPHSTDVTVTVSSTLEVTVGADGFVRAARFDPPLAPEIQTCASTTIYKTRFEQPGARHVPILLER
jgi:ferric-dicitrate binding protein FerR (iron transport regulator)